MYWRVRGRVNLEALRHLSTKTDIYIRILSIVSYEYDLGNGDLNLNICELSTLILAFCPHALFASFSIYL